MTDDLLKTQETYEPADFDGGFEMPPEGQVRLRIESVTGKMHDYDGYTGPRAEIKCVSVDNPKASLLCWVTLPHPNASDGSKKHRALILSRLGFITKGDEATALTFDWKKLEGLEFIGMVEHREHDGKTYANLTFDGWERVEGASPAPQSLGTDAFADI